MLSKERFRLRDLAGGLAVLLLFALSGGCAHGNDEVDFGDNDPSVVVALGDSITFGIFDQGIDSCSESLRETLGYAPRLQALTGKTVINEGICGEHSNEGLWRIDGVLRRWKPGVILIDYSPNDFFSGPEFTIANLRAMIGIARANKTVPIIGTLIPAVGSHRGWTPFIDELNPMILALCEEEGVMCADHHAAFVNDLGFQQSPYFLLDWDGLHPNAAGYSLMARTWLEPLLRLY